MLEKLERLGAGASLVCAIHCLATPLLVGALPLLGRGWAGLHRLEPLLVGVAAGIGLFSLALGFRRHRRVRPLALLALGLGLMIAGQMRRSQEADTPAMVTGALMMAGAQWWNRRCSSGCCSGEAHARPEG